MVEYSAEDELIESLVNSGLDVSVVNKDVSDVVSILLCNKVVGTRVEEYMFEKIFVGNGLNGCGKICGSERNTIGINV